MTVEEKRHTVICEVAEQHGLDPQLLLDLISLEADHANLHAYGARAKLRRAAEALIDAAFGRVGPPGAK